MHLQPHSSTSVAQSFETSFASQYEALQQEIKCHLKDLKSSEDVDPKSFIGTLDLSDLDRRLRKLVTNQEIYPETDQDKEKFTRLKDQITLLNDIETELQVYIGDDTITGDKESAAKRIKNVCLLTFSHLDLSGFELSDLPKSVTHLKLRELDLSQNNFLRLPITVCALTQLEKLNLDSNKLVSLPEEIGKLRRLQRLVITRNPLETLPSTLKTIPNLEITSLFKTNINPNVLSTIKQEAYEYFLNTYLTASGEENHDLKFFEGFNEAQKYNITKFLGNLEDTPLFQNNPKECAQMALGMIRAYCYFKPANTDDPFGRNLGVDLLDNLFSGEPRKSMGDLQRGIKQNSLLAQFGKEVENDSV